MMDPQIFRRLLKLEAIKKIMSRATTSTSSSDKQPVNKRQIIVVIPRDYDLIYQRRVTL